jgi:segregation and condensation protein A
MVATDNINTYANFEGTTATQAAGLALLAIMSSSLAKNAIAFLIDLAERGEIDPWDVQVIDVIDRFLNELGPLYSQASGRAAYEANLSQSGQAFLYASMLLLLKADTLVRLEMAEEVEEVLLPEWDGETAVDAPLPPNLERRIRRRASAAPPPNRRVTLPELIEQLELIAATIADHQPRSRRKNRSRSQSKRQAVRAIAQLAHQENLSEIANILENFLNQYWSDLEDEEAWLDFEQLLSLWPHGRTTPAPPNGHHNTPKLENSPQGDAGSSLHSDNSDRVGVFWALLFLSAQSKVELSQEEFYQDLKVRHLAPMTQAQMNESSAIALPD